MKRSQKGIAALVIATALSIGAIATAQSTSTTVTGTPSGTATAVTDTTGTAQTGSSMPSGMPMMHSTTMDMRTGMQRGGFNQMNYGGTSDSYHSAFAMIAMAVTVILLWIILAEVIVLLSWKIKSHMKQK